MSDKRAVRKLISSLAGYEGLYIVEQHAAAALKNHFLKSRIFNRFPESGGSSRLFSVLGRFLEEKNYKCETEDIAALLRRENAEKPFDDIELFAVEDCISLLILRHLASFDSPMKDRMKLETCVRLMQSTEIYDFHLLYEELSEVNSILSESEICHFPECDESTKKSIRDEVYRYARKHRVSQVEGARLWCSDGVQESNKKWGYVYFISSALITVLFTVIGLIYCGAAALLAIFPLYEAAALTVRAIVNKFVFLRPIPKLQPGEIPENAKTLVVITSLLSGGKCDNDLFIRLERFYHQNKGENVRFGILGDLPDSRDYVCDRDSDIIGEAVNKINALNAKYGDYFCLFVRSRFPSPSEKKYIGREKKRGALLELSRSARGLDTSISTSIIDKDFLENAKYIITLDSDTNLYMGAVSELVFTMLHPENKPVVKDKRVVSGYGVLQPRMTTSLTAASVSPFSVMITGAGGIESYPGTSFDLYQSIFGHGAFCGKGIFDIDVYLEVLDGAFPDETVLSHDLLEGSRLRCGYLSELSLTDSCPQNPASFFKRAHRWIRGDIQTARFAFRYVKNQKCERIKNPAGPLSRYMLLENVRIALTPVFAAVCVFIGLYFDFFNRNAAGILLALALSYLYLPLILSILSAPLHISRRFYSKVLEGVWHTISNTLYGIATLLYTAIFHLDAILRALWRMLISKRHLLEWATFSATDSSGDGFMLYYRKMFVPILAGAALMVFAPMGFFRIIGLLWFLSPVASYFLSYKYSQERYVSGGKKSQLIRYALDAWSYFERFVSDEDNYLPPDNYQEQPVEAVAHRTSPTNIAMYMLSCLAAADFGFITPTGLYERLEHTCETILKMPRFRGQLYNWYDTHTLEVIGVPYVSTVDCGNFAAALSALTQGLQEYSDREKRLNDLIEIMKKLCNEADFRFLYNRSRKLFCIGYDTVHEEQSSNCYDLLMSEARTASYYAVSHGIIPKEHWHRLGRPLIGSCGHIGIASWSGTSFEYFMPSLLLPVYENSLLYEAMGYALFEQAKDICRHMWGRSESGYFAFDADMNYQYRAFGAETLALDVNTGTQEVLAPYSSFLALCMSTSMPCENLEKLKAFGMYGKHGFYEAADFTSSRVGRGHAIIYSYMSHHVGMSIVAAANACFDNIFNRRYMSCPEADAAAELLQERIPVDAPIRDISRRPEPPAVKYRRIVLPCDLSPNSCGNLPATALISNGSSRLVASSDGDIALFDRGIAISYPSFSKQPLRLPRLYFEADGKVYNALGDENRLFGYSGSIIRYETSRDGIRSRTEMSLYGAGCAFNIRLSLDGSFTNACPVLTFEPTLYPPADFLSHPAFCGLTVSCEYNSDEGALLYYRRARKKGEKEFWMSVSLEGRGGFDFICRRDEALPLMYSEKDMAFLAEKQFTNKDGACIMPFCAIKKRSQSSSGKYVCDYLICCASSRSDLLSLLHKVRIEASKNRSKSYPKLFADSLESISQNQLLTSRFESSLMKYSSLVLSCSLFGTQRGGVSGLSEPRGSLWRHGISGDLPIVCLNLKNDPDERQKKIILSFAKTQQYLASKGFRSDLIIVYGETEQYGCPVKREIEEALPPGYIHGHKGGILIISDKNSLSLLSALSVIYVDLESDTIFEAIAFEYCRKHHAPDTGIITQMPQQMPGKDENTILDVYGGAFTNDGFTVYKGPQKAPWSFVYASHQFGTLLTQNSLGFTWFRNSSEFRLTPWSNDPLLDLNGERLLLTTGGKVYDLCAVSSKVSFTAGCAEYSGKIGTIEFKIRAGTASKMPVKLVTTEIFNNSENDAEIKLEYSVRAALGHNDDGCIYSYTDRDTKIFRNCFTDVMRGFGMFVTSRNLPHSIPSKNKTVSYFLLGAVNLNFDRAFYYMREQFSSDEDINKAFEEYGNDSRSLSHFSLQTGNKALNQMFNFYIPYQTVKVRLIARTGFYQSSGAYGFRDQLQDSICALTIDSGFARRQILRAACHQFTTGDVQHWWHNTGKIPGKGDAGVRTRCSDDYLWLPWAVSEYISVTHDKEILNYKLPYIESAPLSSQEEERYEVPSIATHKESIYFHCARAIELALERIGEYGLPLIGSGDWNDGFNRIGIKGRGESVWLALFLAITLKKFAPLSAELGFSDDAGKYFAAARSFEDAVQKYCYMNGYYIRAFRDDGKPIGIAGAEACEIDLLPQVFSAVAFGRTERTESALDAARTKLWDKKYKIFKLFQPPFNDGGRTAGYVGSYVPGVRENGGQYTHAAVWGAMGFYTVGNIDFAYKVLSGINPASRCIKTEDALQYRTEPYALAGDVYSNHDFPGRGGWSQYTGAAGWYYKIVLENLLGYRENGGSFTLSPSLPSVLPAMRAMIKRHDTVFSVLVTRGSKYTVMLDDEKTEGRFYFDKGTHNVKIIVANS